MRTTIFPMPPASQGPGGTSKVVSAAGRYDRSPLRFLLLPRFSAGCAALLGQRLLARETDLPAPVHGDDLHQHLVAFLEHVLHLLHPRVGEIGDVYETV